MKKRTFVSIALTVAFVLALAAPAFAQSMSYQAGLEMDGTIDREMTVGHRCNTGADMKQAISGTGTLTKGISVALVPGKLTVGDTNDFVTAADAVRNLTVTSVITLCAPSKKTYTTDGFTGPVSPLVGWYGVDNMPRMWDPTGFMTDWQFLFNALNGTSWSGVDSPQDADSLHQFLLDGGLGDYDDVSKQIWAAQVSADPGFSGNLSQRFEAAYGPYEGIDASFSLDEEPEFDDSNRWKFGEDEDDGVFAEYGDDYVGNYFSIGQLARTSQGVVKRYISISSPWSHAYLMEDMTVTGAASVQETFTMGNLGAGDSVPGDWWDLF